MYSKKIIKAGIVALAALLSLLTIGLGGAGAFSVDVDHLMYQDDAQRSIDYDFSSGTLETYPPNSILLDPLTLSGGGPVVIRPTGETGTNYLWGQAPGNPLPAAIVSNPTAGKATLTLPTGATEGVTLLYAGGMLSPSPTTGAGWFYSPTLTNFQVDFTAQKAYFFGAGLARDESSGPFNHAMVDVIWVQGFLDGTSYTEPTLIIRAQVENGENDIWKSTPVIRTGLDPATTTLMFDLSVSNGNHFFAAVKINNEENMTSLGEYTLTTEQGSFVRFPDLYPYIYMGEESASTAPQATVQSQHWKDQSGNDVYHAGLWVEDPLHLAETVTVTGYNVTDFSLSYDETAKSWYNTTPVEIGSSPVMDPWPSYTFNFTQQSGGADIPSVTKSITGYVTEFATNLFPTGDITSSPTFSWTAAQGTITGYGIELNDAATGNRVWSFHDIPPMQTSYMYNGPALETGKTYRYNVITQIEQGESWNSSFAEGSFTYNGTSQTTISFTGNVMTAPNWPVTDGMLPVPGATVAAQEVVVPLEYGYSYGQVITNEAGAFSIGGIPASTTFRLTIPTPASTTYVPVLSKFMNWNADIQGLLPFVLFTTDQYNAFGNATETGMILGRVALESSPTSFLSGATIEAREMIPGTTITYGDTYPVTYSGGSSTGTDGIYMVKNVPAGTLVQLQATLSGYTFMFNGPVIPVAAGSVSEDSFFATPVSGSGGTVTSEDAFTTAFPGATLIDFNAIDTSSGHAFFAGNEYAYQGIVFSSPNSQTLYVEPSPTSNWVWTSNYLSPGGAPFVGSDTNEDSLTLTFSTPVSAVSWKFLEMPDPAAVDIRLYDASNNVIHQSLDGAGIVPGTASYSAFWGYASATPIARVEIIDTANNGDDIGFDDFRFATAMTPPAGISFTGALTRYADNTPYGGGIVEQAGNTSITTTTDNTTGAFMLTGLPSGTPFSVKLSPSLAEGATYVSTYTQEFNTTTPITSLRTYNLFTPADLTAWGVGIGQAAIRGRVVNANNPVAGYISGAVVSYSSLQNNTYTVKYEDAYGTLIDGATAANGKFYILGVLDGDTVTVTAANSNYTFSQSVVFNTHSNSVSQGLVKGLPVSGRVAVGGHIVTPETTPQPIKGVKVEEVGATDPVNATVSNPDGYYYLTLPAAQALQFKFSKPQASPELAPTYSADLTFNSEALTIPEFNLFGKTTVEGWITSPATQGIIRARVKDQAGNFIGSAVVTAQGLSKSYQVCYDDTCSGLAATDAATGRYIVKDVDDGDTVIVSAQKEGWTFNPRTFHTHAGAMHQGSLTGVSATVPRIIALSASSGAYGGTLTISGENFGTTPGTVTIGGRQVEVVSWSAESITVNLTFPTPSGPVVVMVGEAGVQSPQDFTITSPHYNVVVVNSYALDPGLLKVIKGQRAEFTLRTDFFNNYTTEGGIAFSLANSTFPTDFASFSFLPVPLKRPGGTVLQIETAGLPAGEYTADVVVSDGINPSFTAAKITLSVLTTQSITFYEESVEKTSLAVTKQGDLNVYAQITASDGEIFYGGMGDTVVILTEVPPTGEFPILGVYQNVWGYDLYAAANGTTTLRATAPDGTTADLPVTVNFPITTGSSYITSIGLAPAEGTTPFVSAPTPTVPNNRTGAITFTTTATTSLGWIGVNTSGMLNAGIDDFLDKLARSTDNLSAVSTFTLQNTPTDLGTAVLYASTSDNGAKAAVPLTTVNAPGTGLLALGVRSLDPAAYAEMFRVLFYGAADNLFKFERNVYAMHIGNRPVPVGNIPPGEYRLLFAPENISVKPQWWPNASVISDALPVAFTADETTADIFFFGAPQPEAVTGPALAEHGHDFTTTTAQEGSVSVTAAPGYVWSVRSDAPWITISSGATGIGSGTVNYQVAANPFGTMRMGTIMIGGQTYTITQAGSGEVPRHVGTWAARQLIHFDDGYNLAGDVAVPWYAEVSKTTLNEDGTGTMMMKKNDHNGELKEQMASFNYSMSPNADGSLTMAITMTQDGEIHTENVRMVISDDGQTALVDGTGSEHQQKLMILCRLHEDAFYGNQTLWGDYYFAGFERNATSVVDPPNGNGAYMTIAGIQTFDGEGHYDYYGWANSVKTDGTNVLWKDTGKTYQPYTVNADGTISAGNGAFIGAVAPTGLIGGGDGTFVNGVNNQSAYFYMKRGDRFYETADIAGTWALAAFGQDSKTTDPAREGFYSSFGTMVCDTAGNCKASLKNRESSGLVSTEVAELAVTIAPDGSFGSFFGDQPPAFAGAIGNNGNTVCFVPGLNYPEGEDPWNREIVVAFRASNIGNLAGGGEYLKGDVNGDGKLGLDDALVTLRAMAGIEMPGVRGDYTLSGTDVNGDGSPGPQELLYILQYIGGLRSEASVQPVPSVTPYVSDANTVLLDHFDGFAGAEILAYSETGASCGSAKPPATPGYSYGSGPAGLEQMLILNPPDGEPAGSGTYLQYPGGQLLSQANGTIEFWTQIPSYGLTLVQQGPFPGSCAGWTFAMQVNADGQLRASAWAAFDMNSGETLIPLNTWTHVAATWGSAGAKLYINGALVGSDANTGMPASGYGGSLLMNYGAGSVSTMIDELRVSNIQRTDF